MENIDLQVVYQASLETGNIIETVLEVDSDGNKQISITEILTAAITVVGKINEQQKDIRMTLSKMFGNGEVRNEFVRGFSDGLDLQDNKPLEAAIEKTFVAIDANLDAVEAWKDLGTDPAELV
jgi:hypothetical protein